MHLYVQLGDGMRFKEMQKVHLRATVCYVSLN